MKSNFTILVSIVVFIFFYNSAPLANDYYVSPSGNDTSGNGTISSPWRTIEYALEYVYPGDILYLRDGVYSEQLFSVRDGTENAYITISSYQNENAFIDGTGVTSGNNGAIITHSYLKFIGFTIRNWNDNGMEISNCAFLELLKLKVTAVTGGIHLTGTVHNFIVDSCIIYDYYGGDGGLGFDATPSEMTDSIYNGVIKNSKAYLTVPATGNCDGFALGHDGVSNISFYNCEVGNVGDAFDISGRNIILENCLAYGSTYGGGFKLWRDDVKLINCIGYDNTSNVELDYDFIVNKGVDASLINCTFFGSSDYNIWIENSSGGSKLELYNCILAGATNTGLNIDGDSISCYTGDYNLFHMNDPERAIVTSEYDFSLTQIQAGEWTTFSGQDANSQVVFNSNTIFLDISPTNPNLHLIAGSAAINNGINLPDAPSFDFDNCPRNVEQIDIGAYEFGACGPVGFLEENTKVFNYYYLAQNYPNPFNPRTKISWQSPVRSHQVLKVFDVLGREVKTLVSEEREAGYHSVNFNASDLPSGVYFYQLKTGNFIVTKKMLLLQ